jgi:hypothetical protein
MLYLNINISLNGLIKNWIIIRFKTLSKLLHSKRFSISFVFLLLCSYLAINKRFQNYIYRITSVLLSFYLNYSHIQSKDLSVGFLGFSSFSCSVWYMLLLIFSLHYFVIRYFLFFLPCLSRPCTTTHSFWILLL